MFHAAAVDDNGTLVIERRPGGYRDRLRSYVVEVDGSPIGEVAPGDQVRIQLSPGSHHVAARIDWTGSDPVEVNIVPGESTRLRVEPTGTSGIATLFGKKPYLRLTPIG